MCPKFVEHKHTIEVIESQCCVFILNEKFAMIKTDNEYINIRCMKFSLDNHYKIHHNPESCVLVHSIVISSFT